MILITRRQDSDQTYVGLHVAAGSRNEEQGKEGIAHFAEHILARDTKNYLKRDRQRIVRDMYGTSNAYTSLEETHYFYHVNKAHVERAIGMLADSVLRPEISPKAVESEAGVIVAEKADRESDAGLRTEHLLNKAAYPDSRLAVPIIGTYDSIRAINANDIRKFVSDHYTADRMILVAVGDVDHDTVRAIASERFKDVPRAQAQETERRRVAPLHRRSGYKILDNDAIEQIDFRVSYPISGTQSGLREFYKNRLVADLLGGDTASPLFRILRGQGFAYSPYACAWSMSDTGLLTINTSFLPSNARSTVRAITNAVSELLENITDEDVAGLKKLRIGARQRRENDPAWKAQSLSWQVQHFGREITQKEESEILASISAADLKEHAKKIFSQAPTIVAHGKNAASLGALLPQSLPLTTRPSRTTQPISAQKSAAQRPLFTRPAARSNRSPASSR